MPKLADGAAPLFQAIPGFPDKIDPARTATFAKVARELSDFQGAVLAARRAPEGDPPPTFRASYDSVERTATRNGCRGCVVALAACERARLRDSKNS